MEDEKGRLDELQQSLYRRDQAKQNVRGWSRFTNKKSDIRDDWHHNHRRIKDVSVKESSKKRRSLSVRFFAFSVVFFVIALAVAGFIINRGSNIVSSDNIDLTVSGPVSIAGGEVLALQIDVVNRNNTTLELVDLLVEFPEGTKDSEQSGESLQRIRENLGDLSPGESESRTVTARIFGEENSTKQVIVGIEYRVVGSNAIFFKENAFDVSVGRSPLSVLVNMPTEINSGQEVSLVAEVISNASETINDVAFEIEYPFGFTFSDAEPSADVGSGLWLFGDLAPQERHTVHVKGTIEGQDTEERTFRFAGGIADGVDASAINTVLLETKRSLTISRPFLQADLAFNGNANDIFVAEPDTTVFGSVSWQNNLPVSVEDVKVEVVFSGAVLNETSVNAQGGFYRSIDNTIIWDKSRHTPFSHLEPGARGQLNFEFRSVSPTATSLERESLEVTLRISGRRIGDTPETTGEISSSIEKTVRIASLVRTAGRATYFTGPFTNSGPIPPQAEQATTYTIIWSVTNSSNDLLSAQVSAALPDYMEWVGAVSPGSESVTFNASGSEVRWDLGVVQSGVGLVTPPREVAFQVRLVPSISQNGSTPVLIGAATFTAQDSFTETTKRATIRELTTDVRTDPGYSFGYGEVGR